MGVTPLKLSEVKDKMDLALSLSSLSALSGETQQIAQCSRGSVVYVCVCVCSLQWTAFADQGVSCRELD